MNESNMKEEQFNKTINTQENSERDSVESTAEFGTWLPFDTAPRSRSCDRDAVLLRGPGGMVTAYWSGYDWIPDGVECDYDMAECSLDIGKPTHWMPLPSPPTQP